MKKILLALCLLALSGTATAQYHGYHAHRNQWGWVGPTIVGGVIGYEIARIRQPVVVQQYTMIPSIPVYNYCGPWTETQNPDGSITRTRTCTQ